MTLTADVRLRRLLAILGWLSRRGGAPTAEIAARFGMSEDEVVSELELAACCGLPPYTPDQLMELIVDDGQVEANLGPELARPRRLTPDEGFTLAASARAILAVPGADPDGVLGAALAKLEGALGDQRQVAVDLDDPPLLDSVRRAAEDGAQLRIGYYSASRDETGQRDVDPYYVFSDAGRWYLSAFCHQAGQVRHFRVDRIESAAPTGESFPRPDEGPPTSVFDPGPEVAVATIVLPPGAEWLLDGLPEVVREPGTDGSVRARVPVGGRAWLARLLLRAGPGARVESPPDLIDVGSDAARAVLAGYR